jgi:PAS domain S-box-containing protein
MTPSSKRRLGGLGVSALIALVLIPAAILAIGLLLFGQFGAARQIEREVEQSYSVRNQISRVFSLAQDAESGQRGYALTGQPRFLDPYYVALGDMNEQISGLGGLTASSPSQHARLKRLTVIVEDKMSEMARLIRLRDELGLNAAEAGVASGRGKALMDEIRLVVGDMNRAESAVLTERLNEAHSQSIRMQVLLALLLAGVAGSVVLAGALAIGYIRARQRLFDRAEQATLRSDAVLEGSMDAILVLSATGRVRRVNRAAELMFGYERADLIDKPASLLIESSTIGSWVPASDLAAPWGATRELQAYRRDGAPFPAEVSFGAMRSGKSVRAVVALRDVTERKQVERAKQEFVSTVSHELRTPLTAIAGSLGILETGALGALSERAARMVYIARASSERLVALINDLLDIEKIGSGQVEFASDPVDLGDVATRAVRDLTGYASDRSITLERLADAGPAPLRGDFDRLVQVATNLISNAVKFSPENSVVSVGVRVLASTAVLSVTDRGAGVPEEFRSRIFTKFAQADSSDTRARGGTGLGLAISREIAERHGGTVDFEDASGGGSTFRLELPLRPGLGGVEPARTISILPWCAEQVLLHVDDDPALAEVVRGRLAPYGRLLHAGSIADATRQIEELTPNIVVLDLVLPDGDGAELIDAIRRRRPETVIIIYTARDVSPALAARVDRVLLKSRHSMDALLSAVVALGPCAQEAA